MISDIIKRLFYPEDFGCVICRKRGTQYEEHDGLVLCDECVKTFTKITPPVCIKCGRKLSIEDSLCKMCAKHELVFTAAASVYEYTDSVRKLMHMLKYSGERWTAPYLARLMAEKYRELGWRCDAVTYVPMHRAKKRFRGYNQAELLAKEFAKASGLPMIPALKRTKHTIPQSKLDADEREQNLVGVIAVNDKYKSEITGKSVIVTDDIMTTGASVNACARALIEAGARNVYGLCAAAVRDKR